MRRLSHWPLIVALFGGAGGCTLWSDQLARAEQHYQGARYEAALANLEDMEPAVTGMGGADRARYSYVRGMTHLRLDQRRDARHWLAIAREENGATSGALTEEATAQITRVLIETDPLGPATRPGGGTSGASSGGDSSSGTSGGGSGGTGSSGSDTSASSGTSSSGGSGSSTNR